MLEFCDLPTLAPGDRVAVLSPSFGAPAKWPHIYELGLQRLRDEFHLEPVEFPTTRQLDASREERARDLVAAFSDPQVKGVVATLGGDDQVTYMRILPGDVFRQNPKPFFGFSDNTHFANHLWLNGVPSFYGGSLFTQFAMIPHPEEFTMDYLRSALFSRERRKLNSSGFYNDIGLSWDEPHGRNSNREYELNEGWYWDGDSSAEGITWGGCLESIDDILRNGAPLPSLEQFEQIVLLLETSESVPDKAYVHRVLRALGERGILARVRAVLVGRPQVWTFANPVSVDEKAIYRAQQREVILRAIRAYNSVAPVLQNMDFGHTNPQICMPYGRLAVLNNSTREILVDF